MSSLDSAVAAVPANARARLSVVLLAVSAFVIVTTEFLIVGLLPALARAWAWASPVPGSWLPCSRSP